MMETGTTQSQLSELSGVKQPSISQMLHDRIPMSDDMLERLLSCMGFKLEVVRRPVRAKLERSV